MKVILSLITVGTLLAWTTAIGGAWGMGPFDNDDALDWVWELEDSDSTAVLESALKDVVGSMFYFSAPECSRAIAAAEVVAALAGKPRPELPDEVASWVRSNKLVADEELINLAKQSVTLVRDSNKSELAELWRDSGSDYDEWHSSLSDLLKRLS